MSEEDAIIMNFPEMEENGYNNDKQQALQIRDRVKNTNNTSVMTNFNPLTALDTYENNNFDGNAFLSQIINQGAHSQYPSHVSTQR